MEILQIKNLTFSYPEASVPAVKNLNIQVNNGDFVVVCGVSGCGKSTLLRLIKKEVSPYGRKEGEILFEKKSVDTLNDRTSAGQFGFIFQDPDSQIVTDYVWHELAFGLENLGYDKGFIRRRVAETASYFGIEEWFNKRTFELSGGQKQTVNLAGIMAMQPKVLLLDEPTAQLDPIAASGFISTLKKLNRELGLTVILAEHRLEDVFPVADKVLLMDGGEGVYFGAPEKINEFFAENPRHPMVKALPSATRIFNSLEGKGTAPLSVRDGRTYLTENFNNRYTRIEEKSFVHSDKKAVELKDVCFRFEKNSPDVIKNLSITVYRGEHFCILGGNGAGKTTALNLIGGALKAYRGKIFIKEKKIQSYKGNSLYLNNLSLLPQNPRLLFLSKTVKEDMEQVCEGLGFSKEETEKTILEISERFGISPLLEMHPFDLSGGELQKAALAKILLTKPDILLMDEPTKGMDAASKENISRILKDLKADGVTVLTVTHDVEFAAATADRCALLFDGDAVSVDTPDKFFAGNNFYTTAANRISAGFFENAVLCEEVAELCRINGKRTVT